MPRNSKEHQGTKGHWGHQEILREAKEHKGILGNFKECQMFTIDENSSMGLVPVHF